MTISLCMIVKNEEKNLARCLDSIIDAVDEIIIVDTGSLDATKSIAQKYTSNIYDFKWIDDFSAARNFAYSKATMDYQMWLDADDIVPDESLKKIIRLKRSLDEDIDIVTMRYTTSFDEDGVPILTFARERLTRREKNYIWIDPVHECIPPAGEILHSDIEIYHKKQNQQDKNYRNLEIYLKLETKDHELTPRQQYYFAKELKAHNFFRQSAVYFEKFLSSGHGGVEESIDSCYNLSICYEKLGCKEKILPILFKSFEFAPPRAEICCRIGYYYKHRDNYKDAYTWFHIATTLPERETTGFALKDYQEYIPNLECCVCCCYLEKYDKAQVYNEIASLYKPKSKAIETNRRYFENLSKYLRQS